MKILYITPWFPAHPNDCKYNFIIDSIKSIVSSGNEAVVLITDPFKPKLIRWINSDYQVGEIKFELFPELNLHRRQYFSIPRGYFAPISIFSYRKFINPVIAKIIKEEKCELIHAHTEIAGISAVDMSKVLKIPSVVTIHGMSTDVKLYRPHTKKLLFEYPLSNATRVILVGKPLLGFAKKFTKSQDHFRILYNGFRSNEYNKLDNTIKKFKEDNIFFISVSNLQEGKGIDLNLHALARLNQAGFTRWSYRIIGEGKEKTKLIRLRDYLKLDAKVEFLGACDHDKVYNYLAQSDVFILPSYREAFGVAYLEAMSFGLLTIGVLGEGPSQFIEHNKNGLLVKARCIDSLTGTLKSIFRHPKKMSDIAQKGHEYVHENFSWQNHAKNLLQIYKEVI